MFFRVKFLDNIKKINKYNVSHGKLWNDAIKKIFYFALQCLVFCILFAIFEKATLGHDTFLKNLFDSIYYLFTSLTTIGYGDISPKTVEGKVLFILFVCLFGVYRMVSIVDLLFQAKLQKIKLKENGRLFMNMKDHVLVFFDGKCLSKNNFLFLERFINENLNSNKFKNNKIALINSNNDIKGDLSNFLSEHDFFDYKVSLINADIYETDIFDKICLNNAKQVYIFGNVANEGASDSKVIDTLIRIRRHGFSSNNISIELIDDSMKKMMMKEYNVSTIIRPTRSYPELIVRSTVSEGTDRMFEELLSTKGDSLATFRIDFDLKENNMTWADLVYLLSKNNIGTALGYINEDNDFDCNPNGTTDNIFIKKLIVTIFELESVDYLTVESNIKTILYSKK